MQRLAVRGPVVKAYTFEVEAIVYEILAGRPTARTATPGEKPVVYGVYARPTQPDEDGDMLATWFADFASAREADICAAVLNGLPD